MSRAEAWQRGPHGLLSLRYLLSGSLQKKVLTPNLDYIFNYFWPHLPVCGILVPQPGIKPCPLHWKNRVLTTGLPWKSLDNIFLESSAALGWLLANNSPFRSKGEHLISESVSYPNWQVHRLLDGLQTPLLLSPLEICWTEE